MTTIYGKAPYAYVYGDNNKTHKQGKVYPEQALIVNRVSGDWLLIHPPLLDRLVDPDYPEFWIRASDTVSGHDGETTPDPIPVPDATPDNPELEVAWAIMTVLQWLKG